MSKGKLIVLEGLDGSGKATQAKLLAEHLAAQGVPVQKITFPDYASDSSALVKMYLSGEFGQRPDDVNAYAASTFYAVDRFASYKTRWGNVYRQNGLIISDRYTTSNAVHQCSKLPPMHWDGFLEWLFEFEYKKLGLPAPDAVVYLAVDPDVSQRLIAQRPARRLAQRRQLLALQPDFAAAGGIQPAQQMQQRALARARRADHRDPLAPRHRQAHPAQHLDRVGALAERLGQAAAFDHRLIHRHITHSAGPPPD